MVQAQAVRQLTYIQAVNEALRQELEAGTRPSSSWVRTSPAAEARPDKEDAWGGPMRLTKGLIGQFGPERIRDTPISEAGFVGAGVGAAAAGLRPVVDLMYVGFFGVCADQIVNNAAKIHYMFGGKVNIPLTIMTGIGGGDQLGGAALGDPLLGVHPLSGPEVRRTVQPLQREGPLHGRHSRRRPRGDLQQQAADGLPRGAPRPRRAVPRGDRQGRRRPGGDRRDAGGHRLHDPHLPPGGRRAGGPRVLRPR